MTCHGSNFLDGMHMVTGNKDHSSSAPIDWAGIGRLYLFFWYFSGLTHLLLQLGGATIFVGFRQALIMSLLWLIPVLLFPHRTGLVSGVIGIVLWFFSLFSLGYFFIYQQEFSQSVIFIIFESNAAESSEFIAQYFAWWMAPAFLVYTAVAYWLWRRVRPVYLSRKAAGTISIVILASLFGYPAFSQLVIKQRELPAFAENMKSRIEPAVPWQMVIGYLNYREQLGNMQELLAANSKIPPLRNLRDANAGLPSTLVLVLGESTNRQHMSLYGYPRPTTPALDAMHGELDVFNNVVASRPYTIETLQQALTFADQNNPDLYMTQPSLLNLMKQAGYRTYWITNQQTMTKRNTMLTTFSQQTDAQYYLNNSRAQNSRQYDDVVLAPFTRILQEKYPRKFIVVHLLGTHMKYEYRYPDEYKKFTDRQGAPDWLTDAQLPQYNSYDNSVLFNDYVTSSLIKHFAGTDPNGFLVYFSDHGEDVFDSAGHDFIGRNEAKPTLPMYAVPFVIWASDKWKASHPYDFSKILDRRYSTSHFIHTWSDLAGLNYDGYDPTKSLVNKKFTERPLWVGDPYLKKPLTDLRTLMEAPGKPEHHAK